MPHNAPSADLRYDVASAVSQGARDYQEDALASDFAHGGTMGFVVLSDGMGGHAAGDVASKIVVTEVFSELKFQSGDIDTLRVELHDVLREAILSANECLRAHTRANPATAGMGATVLAPIFMDQEMFWISVGDSPLYLFRDGELRQLNEDHSLGPQIDFMVNAGLITEELGRDHPDRNCLTSVLIGDQIERIDCPEAPLDLRHDDIIIAASDGLQTLCDDELSELLTQVQDKPGHVIVSALMNELKAIDDPMQDNITICVVKVSNCAIQSGRVVTRPVRRKSAQIVPMPNRNNGDTTHKTFKEATGQAET